MKNLSDREHEKEEKKI